MTNITAPRLVGVPKFAGPIDGPAAKTPTPGATPGKVKTNTPEPEKPRPKLIRGSIGAGIKRMLKMAFLRPRGWAELALHFVAPGVPLAFSIKHFIEGFMGCDSLILPRWFRITNLSGAVEYGEKHGSIVGRFKEVFGGAAKT
ncbi:MAG: hypothetical protein K2X66_03795 [Cyanobacteria bacterium]|nr:hypothetical protein [Cyanobacteriota bacterium]